MSAPDGSVCCLGQADERVRAVSYGAGNSGGGEDTGPPVGDKAGKKRPKHGPGGRTSMSWEATKTGSTSTTTCRKKTRWMYSLTWLRLSTKVDEWQANRIVDVWIC